ncbi:MAG TPA: arginine--tRNA ligase, partial [Saprospiraceae bacterium]|nr:arginine--tRNA ligase [Saprospiraceae bacterium]
MKGIKTGFLQAVRECYQLEINEGEIQINATRKEFVGDYTFVIFPLVKLLKKSPSEIGDSLGNWMEAHVEDVVSHQTIQGFLNVSLSDHFWKQSLDTITSTSDFGYAKSNGKKVLVEFSSPNTNKPLHLGHIRNILLGWSCSKILKANGYDVVNTQVINDRGIAICKSMLAWQKFGNGATPTSSDMKGDHFVGEYYVHFETELMKEYTSFQQSSQGQELFDTHKKADQEEAAFWKEYKNKYFNDFSQLGAEAKKMLLDWENNDPETRQLWQTMNQWVYDGFGDTYQKLGVSFDSLYYES